MLKQKRNNNPTPKEKELMNKRKDRQMISLTITGGSGTKQTYKQTK